MNSRPLFIKYPAECAVFFAQFRRIRATGDARSQDVAKELLALRGARVILATAPNGKAMGSLIDGLGVDGKLMIVGARVEPFAVSLFQLLLARKSLMGWPPGTSIDSEDTFRFAAANGVQPMIETFPLERVAEAYERMISGKVRFRSVLKI